MKLFDPEGKPHCVGLTTFQDQTRRGSQKFGGNQDVSRHDWRTAMNAAQEALTALRDATAHRSMLPTLEEPPTMDADVHSIRSWVLDAYRVVFNAPGGRLLIGTPASFDSPDALAADFAAATNHIVELHQLNRSSHQRGTRSWALPDTHSSTVPAWTSRAAWIAQVDHAVNSAKGLELCKIHDTSPATVLHHAKVYAEYADGATGRGVTASRAAITSRTGMSVNADKRFRRVLRALSLLVDGALGRTLTTSEYLAATLHHGASQSRAASTVHLTTPREFAHIRPAKPRPAAAKPRPAAVKSRPAAQKVSCGPLSPSGFSSDPFSCSGVTHQTRGRARGRKSFTHNTPRPLHLQEAAAALLQRAPGLQGVRHVGSICRVIESAGIDTTIWTGADIASELNRDNVRRGWVWPTSISDPAALLAWRLRRINWKRTSPSAAAQLEAVRREQARAAAEAAALEARMAAASEASRRRAIELFQGARRRKAVAPRVALRPGRSDRASSRAAEEARAELEAVRRSRLHPAPTRPLQNAGEIPAEAR